MLLKGLHIVLMLLIFTFFFLLLRTIAREKLLDKAIHRVSEQMNEYTLNKRREQKNEDAGERKRMLGIEKLLYGSGLKKVIPFMSAELLILLFVLLSATGYFLSSLLGAGAVFRGIALCMGPLLLGMILYIRCLLNYNRIEKNLLTFLNLLDNFSLTDGEITTILYKVSRFLEPPLSDMLQECYYQTQVTGNTSKALFDLMEKAEHPKLKEVIRNLEVCSRYDADYASVVAGNRKSIQDYLAYRKKRKSMVSVAKLELFLLIIMAVAILLLLNVMLQVNIWEVVFQTLPGKIILGLMGMTLLYFYISTVLFNRE